MVERSGTEMINSVDRLKHKIHAVHRQLAALPSLEPGREVNKLFTDLVDLVLYEKDAVVIKDVLSDSGIRTIQSSLQRLCSTGEYHLERYWSGRISEHQYPAVEIERFSYYDNYEQLTDLEFNSLDILSAREIKKVLFIGSGPLPLTSILLTKKFHLPVENIEIDQEAHRLSRTLARQLHLADVLTFYRTDILDFADLEKYDVILVAALVGLDRKEKSKIIRHLKTYMREGALLALRTAHDLRTLLYPEIIPDDLVGFQHRVTIQPFNKVINSVVIVEKP